MARRDEIILKLVDIINADTELRLHDLDESKSLRGGELGLDSVDLVGIIMRTEGEYRIRLSHTELDKVTTIGSLLDLIESKIADAASAPATAAIREMKAA